MLVILNYAQAGGSCGGGTAPPPWKVLSELMSWREFSNHRPLNLCFTQPLLLRGMCSHLQVDRGGKGCVQRLCKKTDDQMFSVFF